MYLIRFDYISKRNPMIKQTSYLSKIVRGVTTEFNNKDKAIKFRSKDSAKSIINGDLFKHSTIKLTVEKI